LIPVDGSGSRALPALLERAVVCDDVVSVGSLIRRTFPEHRVAAIEFASTVRDAAFVIELNTALAVEEAPVVRSMRAGGPGLLNRPCSWRLPVCCLPQRGAFLIFARQARKKG
jgi:hypothetical protein